MNLIERLWRRARDWPPTVAASNALEANRRRGAVAVIMAISAVVLIGFISVGIEVTALMVKQQQMQSAADAAAVAGAVAIATSSPSVVTGDAKAVAANDGFTDGANSVTVTVNNPPASGPTYAANAAVEVIITQPQTLVLASMLYHGAWSDSARAVAKAGSSGAGCVLQTDTGSTVGVTISQGAAVTLNGCGLAANATGASAISAGSGATLSAEVVTVSGSGSATGVTTTPTANNIKFSQPATADPYLGVALPAVGACVQGSTGSSTPYSAPSGQLPTGNYCGGVSVTNGVTVTLKTGGAYTMSGGYLQVSGATLTGTGVTIVLTGAGTNYAYVTINNGAAVTLSAPTTGATAGMVFFQDRAAPHTGSNTTNTFAGTANALSFTGALYFPSQTVSYNNGAGTAATCSQLVAWLIIFTQGAKFNSSCTGVGVNAIGASPSQLVQ